MHARRDRARRVQQQIAKILWEDWDPIGIHRLPAWAPDEYDGYVGGVYRLLASTPTPQQVAEHLRCIEVEQVGKGATGASTDDLLPVARKLLAIDVGLEQA